MIKKIIGICIIVIGSVVLVGNSYNLAQIYFQIRVMKTKTEQQVIDKELTKEQARNSMIMIKRTDGTLIIVHSVFAIVGLGIAFGGLTLYRHGKKDSRLSDSFD